MQAGDPTTDTGDFADFLGQAMRVQQASTSRIGDVDFDALGFGNVFSDHMFRLTYSGGRWHSPEAIPYGPIEVWPSNCTLHYGQAVFEGMKAYRGSDERIRLFRPDRNYARLHASCERLCIPPIDEPTFIEAIETLVRMDRDWVPRSRGESLYIRPIIFADEGLLEVRSSTTFQFVIFTAPVRGYFGDGGSVAALKVEEQFTRAAPGGIGAAKTAGNYAASLYPGEQARREGYAQVLWLDGKEHRFVEEAGAMNIFFRLGDRLVTPRLAGSILPGVTRDSVLTLLRDRGEQVEERPITIDEVVDGARSGELIEAFGAGTAAVIAPVGKLAYRGEEVVIGSGEVGELTGELFDQFLAIQHGESNDRFGWTRVVETDPAIA